MSDDNAVKAALYAKLTGGTALGALLAAGTAGVYEYEAPEGDAHPFVVYFKSAGTPRYTFTGPVWDDYVFTVKGVTEGGSSLVAGQIADALDDLLMDAQLSISGRAHLFLRRVDDVDYPETEQGTRRVHKGATYRLWAGS